MEKSKNAISKIIEKLTAKAPDNSEEKFDIGQALEVVTNLAHAARKFKSVHRAIKRGHATEFGMVIARRPFNNRANTSKRKGVHSRIENQIKRRNYEAAKAAANRESL